ncbi:MAG: beta-lactamase family protein [Chitinispirillaceae bacterium]|nr:beta-lactamase family protein [Chitinispirillaceae bacterium]
MTLSASTGKGDYLVAKVSAYLEDAVNRRVFPGCSAGVIAGDCRWCGSFGKLTYEPASDSVSEETVYDVASITKSLPVSSLALTLIEKGVLNCDDRLIDTVPEFNGGYRQEITIRHLLTHTLDFGFRLSAFKHLSGSELLAKILSAPLRRAPGSTFSYANATSILLGLSVERLSGRPLDEAADGCFFKPLGMRRTTFHPERLAAGAVAPAEDDPWRGRVVCAEVHDESAFALRPRIVGSAGLFSTAPDLLKFAAMLIDKGTAGGKRFFLPETIGMMHSNALAAGGNGCTGYGWELAKRSFMGKRCGAATFGKTGFTGCSIVVDPGRKTAIVLLSNHTFPRRRRDRSLINEVRAGLADIVFEAVATVR